MKIKVFFFAATVFALYNFGLNAAMPLDLGSRHDVVTHTLNLSGMGITDESFKASFVEIMCFINNNKVEILSLEGNSFQSPTVAFLKQVTGLLTSSASLKTISLKNNFKKAMDSQRGGPVMSPAILEQITAGISQFQAMFKESLAESRQQTQTEYITKEILFDDMPPLSIISEIKLPLTGCQQFITFLKNFSVNVVSIVVSVGGTILIIYLTGGNVAGTGWPCPSNSTNI